MNKVKKTTLKNRIRDAVRAFQGKPKDTIDLGVRVNRCDECERNNDCGTCVYKHKFLELMELPNCSDCALNKTNGCSARPNYGEHARINCPLHIPKEMAKR